MVDAFELHVHSDPRFAKIVRCSVDHACGLCGFSDKTCRAIILAVDEAFTNIIRHAYRGNTGEIVTVRCRIREDRLEIVMQDKGTPGDPEHMKPRSLEDIRPGGLGLHLINSAMDRVDYQSTKQKGNVLTLTKFFDKTQEQ